MDLVTTSGGTFAGLASTNDEALEHGPSRPDGARGALNP
jgi:hypothetical protein